MRSHDKTFPFALSFRYLRNMEKKLSISASNLFFSAGSVTVSARALRALRIWDAATLVDAFSKACNVEALISCLSPTLESMALELKKNKLVTGVWKVDDA